MLRTQEAALYGIGDDGMAGLCEAICLDAVEVADVSRVSIWFFDERGDMVCQRQLDAREGRFQQGAIIPRSATQAYIDAAGKGLGSLATEDAPVHDSPADVAARLDLLLVDSNSRPSAIFRCERCSGSDDWRPRDITILRNLAQTLAGAIRQHCDRFMTRDAFGGLPSVAVSAMGSARRDLSWLRRGSEPSIWLQSLDTANAFDALGLNAPYTDAELQALFSDDDDADAY
jgi:hypothetical protein